MLYISGCIDHVAIMKEGRIVAKKKKLVNFIKVVIYHVGIAFLIFIILKS